MPYIQALDSDSSGYLEREEFLNFTRWVIIGLVVFRNYLLCVLDPFLLVVEAAYSLVLTGMEMGRLTWRSLGGFLRIQRYSVMLDSARDNLSITPF